MEKYRVSKIERYDKRKNKGKKTEKKRKNSAKEKVAWELTE